MTDHPTAPQEPSPRAPRPVKLIQHPAFRRSAATFPTSMHPTRCATDRTLCTDPCTTGTEAD